MNVIFIITSFIYSVWLGGAATTLLYRIPRNITISPIEKPRCANCNTVITFLYFLPIIGYIFHNGKCLNCQKPIPSVYLKLEVCITIISFVVCSFSGYTNIDNTIIATMLLSYLVLMLFMHHVNSHLSHYTIFALLIITILYKGYYNILPGTSTIILTCIFLYKLHTCASMKQFNISSNVTKLITVHIMTTTPFFLCFMLIILAFLWKIYQKNTTQINKILPYFILANHMLYFLFITIALQNRSIASINKILSWFTI